MTAAALAGVKVIERCQLVAGPFCAKIMADMGAEVVKIEEPGFGDEARAKGPYLNDVPHPERSGLFLYLNTNKLGITLNLKADKGRKIFEELIKEADILVEDNPPGTLDSLGLGYEELNKLNPRLILTSITPFGQSGPYKDYEVYPVNSFHSSGEGYINAMGTAFINRPPVKLGRFAGEYEVGIHAALGTLLALYFQKATGLGQHVDISKQEALTSTCLSDHVAYTFTGLVPTRATDRSYNTICAPCKDGYVEIHPVDPYYWQKLAELMGNPEWTESETYRNHDLRRQHLSEIKKHIFEWASTRTKDEIYREALQKQAPVAPYLGPGEIMQSEMLNKRGFFAELDHSHAGRISYITAPYRLAKSPWQTKRAAPLLGEHNEQVYCQRLGYSKQELVRLRGLGVI